MHDSIQQLNESGDQPDHDLKISCWSELFGIENLNKNAALVILTNF